MGLERASKVALKDARDAVFDNVTFPENQNETMTDNLALMRYPSSRSSPHQQHTDSVGLLHLKKRMAVAINAEWTKPNAIAQYVKGSTQQEEPTRSSVVAAVD